MRFKGNIVALKASVTASGDSTRRVTLVLHEEQPAAFASLDYLLGKTLNIRIDEEKDSPFSE